MANKEIYVKIQKVSSGVQFTILNARTRNPVARKMSEKDRRDLGFADGTFDAPVMADSGSTPTNARAKRLLCYQAPLNRVVTLVNIQFERVITIGEEPGMFAASSQSV